MKPIFAITVPQKDQRYFTLGDYVEYDHIIQFRISKQKDERMEQLIFFHELIEKILCMDRGISEHDIEHWDAICEDYEPGENPHAPYHAEHMFAESLERKLCKELGIDWDYYCECIRI
jgi:hypothetical protein